MFKLSLTFLVFRHLDSPRMFALDHTQLGGLNPHTASFIRSDFIRDPLTWVQDFVRKYHLFNILCRRDQLLPYTSKLKRRAIRAAGGTTLYVINNV